MDLIQLRLLGFAFGLVFGALVLGPMIGVSWLLDRRDRRRAEAARRAAGPTPAAAPRKAACHNRGQLLQSHISPCKT